MISVLKLYAPAIVLLIEAGLLEVGDGALTVVARLLVLAVALAVSISEQRRLSRERHGQD